MSQHTVDGLVVNYIVKEMRPLSTVEKPAFQEMITGINPAVTVMCRKTLSNRLDDSFQRMQQNLKSQLADVKYVCTTADIWTVNRKSYMGMTVHYMKGGEDLSRLSAALAFRRFLGSHTYEAIAEMISAIHSSYGLTVDKITATVTDNASNFGKAFREFLFQLPADEELRDDVDIVNAGEVLSACEVDELDICLPPHETCCSHSLNLLAAVDADKVSDTAYKRQYRAAIAKCTTIWNTTHRSSKASDAVKLITDKAIMAPGATRWNSQYDSLKQLLQIGTKLNDVCQALNTPQFKKAELECLNEYVSVMQPVAVALDKLQGEKTAYFGHILPTFHMVVTKLKAMQKRYSYTVSHLWLPCWKAWRGGFTKSCHSVAQPPTRL